MTTRLTIICTSKPTFNSVTYYTSREEAIASARTILNEYNVGDGPREEHNEDEMVRMLVDSYIAWSHCDTQGWYAKIDENVIYKVEELVFSKGWVPIEGEYTSREEANEAALESAARHVDSSASYQWDSAHDQYRVVELPPVLKIERLPDEPSISLLAFWDKCYKRACFSPAQIEAEARIEPNLTLIGNLILDSARPLPTGKYYYIIIYNDGDRALGIEAGRLLGGDEPRQFSTFSFTRGYHYNSCVRDDKGKFKSKRIFKEKFPVDAEFTRLIGANPEMREIVDTVIRGTLAVEEMRRPIDTATSSTDTLTGNTDTPPGDTGMSGDDKLPG